MNREFDQVYINNAHVDRNTSAGPLPDFAVLEFEGVSYFWWLTATALDYMPVSWSPIYQLAVKNHTKICCNVLDANALVRMTAPVQERAAKGIVVSPAIYKTNVEFKGIIKLIRPRYLS